jgi:hypothetical protein
MEGELCVDVDPEWHLRPQFDRPLVRFSFRKKLYDRKHSGIDVCILIPLKTGLPQRLTALPIFPLLILNPMSHLDDAIPGPQAAENQIYVDIFSSRK